MKKKGKKITNEERKEGRKEGKKEKKERKKSRDGKRAKERKRGSAGQGRRRAVESTACC